MSIKEILTSNKRKITLVALIVIIVISLILFCLLLAKPQSLSLSKLAELRLPQLPPSPQVRDVNLGENFTMKVNDEVEVTGTGLRIKFTNYKIPPEGSDDFPYYVSLKVQYQGSSEEFTLTVGGSQSTELGIQRRQKNVFGHNIFVQKVEETEVTLRVSKTTPQSCPSGQTLVCEGGSCECETISTCQAEWYGYEFNAATGVCELKSFTGCNSPFKYKTKEECESAK